MICFRNGVSLALGLVLLPAAVFGQSSAQKTQSEEQTAQTKAVPAVISPEDQPSKEQLMHLFKVMRLREQMASLMKTLPSMMQQQVAVQAKAIEDNSPEAATLTPEQKAAIEKLTSKYMEKALNIYTVDEMISDMSAVYKRHLSKEDVDAFIAFYSSPAGQHLLDQQPAILKEYMPIVMNRVQERSKELADEMTKEMKGVVNPSTPASK